MDKREFKDKVYSVLSQMVKAMANPHRLEIIDLLGQGERSVEEIARETNLSVANASQHLQVLRQSNLLQVKRKGNFIYYSLAGDNVYKSWKDLREIGLESLAEIDKLIKDFRIQKSSLEAISFDELMTRMKSGKTILLDVRPEVEFNSGHIPGAVNIPIEQFLDRTEKLSKSKQYIVYCRGPFCVFADEAVQILSQEGFKAKRLQEGFPDWKANGLPVSSIQN
ncbi:metalloregulator ArsR/SmtB family transcription factor [Chitinophagaceae bacterium LB-8]|uniref:Metalloregulator ArsR/SmtB family transcription factor n=1 Tax=Paraflavisolibacter caeni TaxID=2982496 RepID=A0A9X3B8B8_9BACT|nr:metalloregulator ArsR/SmtB family transcription factor [Paraflavisolibacter caeni]MCU7550490.1 metalloregulator ArsR/SmtB family transcription factor [Paraflavisolibacter caeni]